MKIFLITIISVPSVKSITGGININDHNEEVKRTYLVFKEIECVRVKQEKLINEE